MLPIANAISQANAHDVLYANRQARANVMGFQQRDAAAPGVHYI